MTHVHVYSIYSDKLNVVWLFPLARFDTRLTYAASGVSINDGNGLVESIKPLASGTSRAGCKSAIGGFGGVFDLKAAGYKDPLLVSGTDGVGTKLKVIVVSRISTTLSRLFTGTLVLETVKRKIFVGFSVI